MFYENVLREYFKAPSMLSSKGRYYWSATVIAYWALAWVIGSAIPSINALVTLVGAACILQFTYTFPPILALGFWMQIDAGKADNPWAPGMAPGSNRIDTWRDKSRWIRGLQRYWYVKVLLVSTTSIKYSWCCSSLTGYDTSSWSSSRPGQTVHSVSTRVSRQLLLATRARTTFLSRAMRPPTQGYSLRARDEHCFESNWRHQH